MKRVILFLCFIGLSLSACTTKRMTKNMSNNPSTTLNTSVLLNSLVLDGKTYRKGDLLNDYLGEIQFHPGTTELKEKSYKVLDKLTEVMLFNHLEPRVQVGVHIDSLSNQFSLVLSQKRSDAIKSYLQDVKGVPLGRIVAVGFGRTQQAEGKEGERVEFKLIAIQEDDE